MFSWSIEKIEKEKKSLYFSFSQAYDTFERKKERKNFFLLFNLRNELICTVTALILATMSIKRKKTNNYNVYIQITGCK